MSSSTQPDVLPEISLVEAVWRYRIMSLIIVWLSVILAAGATMLLFTGASAKGQFAVTDPTNKDYLQMGIVSGPSYASYTAQRAAFAKSGAVLQRASKLIADGGGPKYGISELRAVVQTSTKPDGGVVEVNATAPTVPKAAAIVNAVMSSYQQLTADAIAARRASQLRATQMTAAKISGQIALMTNKSGRQYQSLITSLIRLQSSETQLQIDANRRDDGVQFINKADPEAKTPSRLPRNAVIGLAVGVLLSCVVSFLRASAPPGNPILSKLRWRKTAEPVNDFRRIGAEPHGDHIATKRATDDKDHENNEDDDNELVGYLHHDAES
jgi:capsular polysaccharide biosynthesis protein